MEALIITCSDQQVFTGGAYAIALRYAKACSVSAYHYNIVANILLVTCATHLMAVTTARHYWEHPWVSSLRVVVTTLVFIVTGFLLANQGSGSLGFPTEVPAASDQYSPMLLPAACFQTVNSHLNKEVSNAFKSGSAHAFFTGQIHGWANYLIMFMFYVVAVCCISVGRLIRRGRDKKGGRRRTFVLWLHRVFPFFFRIKKLFYLVFALYLLASIALSAWTVAISGIYVFNLRNWVDKSEWHVALLFRRTGMTCGLTATRIQKSSNGRNPENDPSTFGQLVPLLLMSLTVFTFVQIINGMPRSSPCLVAVCSPRAQSASGPSANANAASSTTRSTTPPTRATPTTAGPTPTGARPRRPRARATPPSRSSTPPQAPRPRIIAAACTTRTLPTSSSSRPTRWWSASRRSTTRPRSRSPSTIPRHPHPHPPPALRNNKRTSSL